MFIGYRHWFQTNPFWVISDGKIMKVCSINMADFSLFIAHEKK
jgi:hypothetical protein